MVKRRIIEIQDKEIVVFSWRYIEQKRVRIFEKALERATRQSPDDSKAKFFIVEDLREAGYLNQSYPSTTPEKYEEISRREVTKDYIERLMSK